MPAVEIWCAHRTLLNSPAPIPLTSISGDPRILAADNDALHILFSDLTQCDYFPNRPYSPGPRWLDQCRAKPLAWGGDSKDRRLWAIVETSQLTPLAFPPSQPSSTQPADAHPNRSESLRETRHTLLELHQGVWQRRPAPPWADNAATVWITGAGGEPVVIWSTHQQVFSSTRRSRRTTPADRDDWTAPVEVIDRRVHHGWAGYADGPVFVAGIESSSSADARHALQLRLLLYRDGAWRSAGDARDGNELLTVNPEADSVAIARGELVVARLAAAGSQRGASGGGVDLGTARLTDSPTVRFTHLAMKRETSGAPDPWQDAIVFGVVLGLMTVTLVARRDEATRVLVLPGGFAPAAVWRRILATFVDFFPAFVATAPWWLPKVADAMLLYGPAFSDDPGRLIEQRCRYEIYAMIAAYGAWCFAWEASIGTTAGKLLLGCRVLSTDGGRPTVRQCLARNVVRILMVAMGAPGLLVTLMTIIIVTRNRQRIGDLLARTIVVEKQAFIPPEESPTEEPPRAEGE